MQNLVKVVSVARWNSQRVCLLYYCNEFKQRTQKISGMLQTVYCITSFFFWCI